MALDNLVRQTLQQPLRRYGWRNRPFSNRIGGLTHGLLCLWRPQPRQKPLFDLFLEPIARLRGAAAIEMPGLASPVH